MANLAVIPIAVKDGRPVRVKRGRMVILSPQEMLDLLKGARKRSTRDWRRSAIRDLFWTMRTIPQHTKLHWNAVYVFLLLPLTSLLALFRIGVGFLESPLWWTDARLLLLYMVTVLVVNQGIKKHNPEQTVSNPVALAVFGVWWIVNTLFLTVLACFTLDGGSDWGTRDKKAIEEPMIVADLERQYRGIDMRQLFYKSYVNLYRVTAVVVLYGMFAAIAAYALLMGFYSVNKSWVAPVLISPSNDKILSLTAQMVASQQALDSLNLITKSLREARAEMVQRRAVLQGLNEQLELAAARQKSDNITSGEELTRLATQKHADLRNTQSMLSDLDQSESDVERNLKAGLITRSEALAQKTTLAQFRNAYTDAQVSEVVLKDSVRQKMSTDLSVVDTMSKAVELRSELAQLDLNIKTGDDQIVNNKVQIENIQKAIRVTCPGF